MKNLPANWQTTVSGIGAALMGLLTLLAAAPYQLGDVATIISPEHKASVFVVGMIATFLLRTWNSVMQKDQNVTGGTVVQDHKGDVVAKAKT